MAAFARPELLATTEWLADNLHRPDLRVLDVRWRPDGSVATSYAAGHIPGAVHVDWAADLVERPDEGDAVVLAAPERVASVLGRAGVGDGTTVVLYDDTIGLYAARAWWTLHAYGFAAARILDGGFPAWTAEGRPISNSRPDPTPATFTPSAVPRVRLVTADIRAMLGSAEILMLDARAPAEYRGFEGNTRRLGHIPGAVNVPVGQVHEPGSQRLHDPETLRRLFLRANVTRGRRLVCYDGSGVAAARLAFVLALLGHEDVAVYDGGWAEWGDRLDLPVDR